jgi:hypothetical protein
LPPPSRSQCSRSAPAWPLEAPTARSTDVDETKRAVIETIRFTGATLKAKTYTVRDRNLVDGSALVVIAQRGLASVIDTKERAGVKFRPNRAPNRLTIRLLAAQGGFTKVVAQRDDGGRSIVIVATKASPPRARSANVVEREDAVIETIRFTGGTLSVKPYAVRDRNLADGSALVVIAQRGLTSVIGTNERAGVKFRPSDLPNRLTIELTASPDAFTDVKARRGASGRSIVIIARKASPPPGTTGSGGAAGGGTGGDSGGGRGDVAGGGTGGGTGGGIGGGAGGGTGGGGAGGGTGGGGAVGGGGGGGG